MPRSTSAIKHLVFATIAFSIGSVAPVSARQSQDTQSLQASVARASGHSYPGASRSHRHKWPQASLQAQAVTEVAHDRVKITLASEISDTSQESVSEALSTTLKKAMTSASENTADIKVTSGNYRIWPMNDKDGRISNWRGRGELYLESADFAAASTLAASLADTMAISSVSFFVSPQKRAAEEAKLLNQAAAAFRKRAQALTQALGYSEYRLRSIDLGGSGAQFEAAPRAMQAAAMFKAADAVPLEGGTEMISVSIQGSVFLLDEKR